MSEKTKPAKTATSKAKTSDKAIIEPTTINPIDVTKEPLSSDKVDEYLIKAVYSVANPSGWARLAAVGEYLRTYTPIDYHDYNFLKLQAFLKSRKLFEFKEEKGHPILRVMPK